LYFDGQEIVTGAKFTTECGTNINVHQNSSIFTAWRCCI